MKINFRLLSASLLAASFVISGCASDDEEATVVDVAADMPDTFSSLVRALERGGLDDDLAGPGPFTVFAPTNSAFQALLDTDPAWNTVDDIPLATLTTVLQYHVVAGREVASSNVVALSSPAVENLAGLTLWLDAPGGVEVNNVPIVTADVAADNGVIHVIDSVLLPPSAAEFAAIADLTSLVAAVQAADPAVGTLLADDTATLTVFAPTDQAFVDLLNSQLAMDENWTTLGDIPQGTLTQVLQYHVISGTAVDSGSIPASATTALGQDLAFDTSGGGVVINPSSDTANVAIADLAVTNGLVHVIDAVLVPTL